MLRQSGGLASGKTFYGYCRGDPVGGSDPSGLQPQTAADWTEQIRQARAADIFQERVSRKVDELAAVATFKTGDEGRAYVSEQALKRSGQLWQRTQAALQGYTAWARRQPANIDWPRIEAWEGHQQTVGYVPTDDSGVTIGAGVDLGQHTAREIRNIVDDQDLADRLVPYAATAPGRPRVGESARTARREHPLTVTEDEARQITQAFQEHMLARVQRQYNTAVGPGAPWFQQLPSEAQTVILSVAYNMGGNLATTAPIFWRQVLARDWAAASANLTTARNWTDNRPRRAQEGRLLQQLTR